MPEPRHQHGRSRQGERVGIFGFVGTYRFLSNFYVEPDGTHVEGEYQRAKCATAQDRRQFHVFQDHEQALLDPRTCKFVGRRVEMRSDWEDVKVDIMLHYVRKKFKDHPSLAAELRATGTYPLWEMNPWGDHFWGCDEQHRGLNVLGEILMQVRHEL